MAVDHHRLLGRLNRTLGDNADARFVTLVLASARREGATVRLRLTCAGHPPPLIVRADGRVEEAETQGSLIGGFGRAPQEGGIVVLRDLAELAGERPAEPAQAEPGDHQESRDQPAEAARVLVHGR
jgi:hypothetical protein